MIAEHVKVLRNFGGLFYEFKIVSKFLYMSSLLIKLRLITYKSNIYHNLIG